MGLSLFLWVCLLGVPFLPLSVAARGTVATALIVIAEVAFWLGAVMAGPGDPQTQCGRGGTARVAMDAGRTAKGIEPDPGEARPHTVPTRMGPS